MSDEDDRGTGAETPDSAASPPAGGTASDDGDDREWRFDIDEFDEEEAEGAAVDAEDDEDGNVAGSLFDLEDEIEPGAPTLEGTMFVVLGALATILFLLEAGGAI
jgi:transcription initiation factor TFIID subunit TAF12